MTRRLFPPCAGPSLAWLLKSLVVVALAGCATSLPSKPESLTFDRPVVFGRALVVLTGPSPRWYGPEIEFIEVENRQTHELFRLSLQSDDKLFLLNLDPGEYQVTRIQIREGPFTSMASFEARFEVGTGTVTYLGTWRFGLDTPRYGRMVLISMVREDEQQAEAERQLTVNYPTLTGRPITALLPEPAAAETRLYEVMPYPRVPRYFLRHWW